MNLQLIAQANLHALSLNPYPGRFIAIGMDDTGKNLAQVYAIMGRSGNSRNRRFEYDGDEGRIYTEAADPAKMSLEDARLVIYNAMREGHGEYVVSNGDQTDTVMRGYATSHTTHFEDSLKERCYEPDKPNFTPRITGRCHWVYSDARGAAPFVQFSVIRRSLWGEAVERPLYSYEDVAPGFAFALHTYMGDGNPLPSFRGEPILLPLAGTIDEIAAKYWDTLNEENRVSLVIKFIPKDGSPSSVKIINKYQAV